MKKVTEFKTSIDDLNVEYEIDLPFDIQSPEDEKIYEGLTSVDSLITASQQKIEELNAAIYKLTNHADVIDYIIAVSSGLLAGIIDSFFVGEFSLDNETRWGKEKVDAFVKYVAKERGYKGDLMSGAVKFLEKKFPIPADSATTLFGGGTQHHLRDFSHHPTPVGLIFSMLTQFTKKVYGTNTFGAFIIKDVPPESLIGNDFASKIAIGFINWIFHMVSDIAASSGSIIKGKYGTGLPGPFVSLIKEISSFRFFNNEENNNKFSLWISKLFNGTLLKGRDENGKIIPESVIKFDLRAELGVLHEVGKQSIPVIINECVVRISYFVRRLILEFKNKEINTFNDFIYTIDWKNTLPFKNRTIVRMLTISTGTFVAVDLADAAIRSAVQTGGPENPEFWAKLVLKVNFVGVGRFAIAVGTDGYMGNKREKLRKERMQLYSQQIFLYTSKVYYKEANMWIAAKNAQEAFDDMYDSAEKAILAYQECLRDIYSDILKISKYKEDLAKKNPSLLDEISNKLLY